MRWINWIVGAAFAIVTAIVAGFVRAQPAPMPDVSAVQCPAPPPQAQGQPGICKVITITPFEEQALIGERGILDTAAQGRPLDLTGAVNYFREKIRSAPAGKPVEKKGE